MTSGGSLKKRSKIIESRRNRKSSLVLLLSKMKMVISFSTLRETPGWVLTTLKTLLKLR